MAGVRGERERGRQDWAITQGKAAQKKERVRTRGDGKSPVRKGSWKCHLGFQFEGGERPGAWGGEGEGTEKEEEMERKDSETGDERTET